MTKMYIEIQLTNAHADQLVKDNLSEDFSMKFIRGKQYTDIRFGPLELEPHESDKVRDALDFLIGLKPRGYMLTSKPY